MPHPDWGRILCAAGLKGLSMQWPAGKDDQPLLSAEAQRMLQSTTELDYMTHIVFRMYENMQ